MTAGHDLEAEPADQVDATAPHLPSGVAAPGLSLQPLEPVGERART